ncbi:MAG: hypothetical protein KDN18_17195 [Verrucomicrobiae bacterium]|nr:hypothetical protein [Verrucomicrobiae bacterium]
MNELRLSLPIIAALSVSGALLHAQSSEPTTVKGSFLGDGKEGNLAHLIVQTREPFSDQAAIRLVFTEKDPSASKKPDFDAGFKKLGSALILSVFRDGGIFGCEVAHTAHEKSPFSALGQIKMEDFKVTDSTVSGRVTTGGELDAFGQKWNVDLTFSAPLPKGAFAEEEVKPMTKEAPKEEPAKPAGPKLSVSKLPLPASAQDVEYKAVVGHINFRSDASVSEVAGEFSAKLKEQGWKDGSGSLNGKTNAILKRERDGAKLTIMVQPAASGCSVKVFTEGLDWSDSPKAGAANPTATLPTDPAAIEAEVQKKLQEALKGLPGF